MSIPVISPKRWLCFSLAIAFGWLLGLFSFSVWDAPPSRVERVAWAPTVQWIGPSSPNYRLYARRTIDLSYAPQSAWMRFSADNDFVLYVNGRVVARELSVVYNSLGLSSQLDEISQSGKVRRLVDSVQYVSDRLPYRWLLPEFLNLANVRDWKITPYIDLTALLKTGKNVIAVEVQKGRKNPRLAVEGAIYTAPDATPIDLSTGSSPWQTTAMFETRQGIPWFDPAFAADDWGEAPLLGFMREATYSRLSQHLFDEPLHGEWVTAIGQAALEQSSARELWLQNPTLGGQPPKPPDVEDGCPKELCPGKSVSTKLLCPHTLSRRCWGGNAENFDTPPLTSSTTVFAAQNQSLSRGVGELGPHKAGDRGQPPGDNLTTEAWLQTTWQIPTHFQRAFVQVIGKGEVALLLNGQLVKRFESELGNQMHLFEVTRFLHPGANTITARLARPLTPDPSIPGVTVPQFLLDGWVENQGQVAAAIATSDRWQVVSPPEINQSNSSALVQPVSVLGPPDPRSFLRVFEGDANLLNYPNYVSHQMGWILAGIGVALGLSWLLGRFWLEGLEAGWQQFEAGTALLLPATLFLVGISLLKHRYLDGEQGLLFVQPQSNALILVGCAGVLVLTLLGYQIHRIAKAGDRWATWGRWGLGVGMLAIIAAVGFTLLGAMIPAYPPALGLAIIGLAIGAGLLLLPIAQNGRLAAIPIHFSHATNQDPPAFGTPLIKGGRGDRCQGAVASIFHIGMNQLFQSRWLPWLLLGLIVVIGFGLRVYNLDFMGLEADENTSLDAIRGILRTGAPTTVSGIWYTRSPAYHYLTAVWLLLVGDTPTNARWLSVLWGTATLVLVFAFTRKITGNVWIALIVTALMALDPWEIWYSRSIRFYQIVQFSTIAMLWWFLNGFVEGRSRLYQWLFFVALTWTLLNQEGMIVLLPGLFLGFLCFYRSFRLAEDWQILLGAAISGAILYYDLLFVKFKTVTPWVAISTTTGALVKLHLGYISAYFINFFIGPGRIRIIFFIFFFLGFWLFLKRKDSKILFLFSVVLLTVLTITLIIVPLASRYTYPVYPIFIMLAVYSAVCLITAIANQLQPVLSDSLPLRAIALSFAALLLVGNLEIGRVLNSYGDAIVFRSTEVSEYIRDHRQPGDIVISTFPAAHANTIGRPDYVIPYRTSIFDAIYQRDGQVRDRWDGGVLINSVEALNRVLQKSDRVWIHLFDRLDRPLPNDPKLAEFRNYLQLLGEPAMETFGTRLRLWRKTDGILPQVNSQGKDLGNY